jgi:asparagine synthase (glutamine-hydrolysing)
VEGFSEYLDFYFHPDKLKEHGLFNEFEILKIKELFLKGHTYLSGKVWTVLIFQMWYDKWMK